MTFLRSVQEYKWILIVVLVSAFFHFYNLGLSEFVNDETIAANYLIRVLYGFDNPLFFGSLFIYPHPPVRILASIPFVLLFGMTEFAMRFPNALFGTFAIFPLYGAGRQLYGRQVALLSSLLYAISGVSAVNRQGQGVGIYVFFVLLAFYYLVRFIKENDQARTSRYMLIVSMALTIATYTYLEAIMFMLPVVYFVARKYGIGGFIRVKGIRKASFLYLSALTVYFLLWYIMPQIALRFGYIRSENAGNVVHLNERLSGVGAFNLFDIFVQYIEYNSLFYFLLVLLGIIAAVYWGWSEEGTRINTFFVLPHLLIWTVFFKNIVMHPMYDLALIALLAAGGLVKTLSWLRERSQAFGQSFALLMAVFIGLSAWHHYVAHNQSQISFKVENGLIGGTVNRPIQLGSKAAGYFVRMHSPSVTDRVFTLGTGSAEFYSGRLQVKSPLPGNEIETLDDVLTLMQSSGWHSVRYVIITRDNYVLWEYVQANYALEAIVTVKGAPSLYLFNALAVPAETSPQLLASEQYEAAYDKAFSNWRETLPWFLLLAQERL